MSAKVFALVGDYYDPARFGAPIVLAYVLADACNDYGIGITLNVEKIAQKTRQTIRAVQKQMRKLEDSRLLVCEERSVGGRGISARYRLDLGLLTVPLNPEPGTGFDEEKPRTRDGVLTAETPNQGRGFDDHHIRSTKELRQRSVETHADDVSTFTLSDDVKLAQWMFGRLVALNPKLRTPSWLAWAKVIRLMRERDRRTLREIAELFAFANADEFWQANIESPGALRRQWNKLALKRQRAGGNGAAAPAVVDTSCAGVKEDGSRCGAKNTTGDSPDGRGPFFCWACREAGERARAREIRTGR